MAFFKWFYPGMRVKRWIFLMVAGLSLIFVVALYGIKVLSESSIFLALFVSALVILGLFIVFTAIKNILKSIVNVLVPERQENLVDLVYRKRLERVLEQGPRIVVVGGGTGLSVLLEGIKEYTTNISAIVTVTDTGGSSGRLRDEFDMPPPGDIRNCLVALADKGPLMGKLFQYRFNEGEGLKGHSFGNLFITAMSQVTGCFDMAVKESSKVLSIRGQVVPSTLDQVQLVATFEDGSKAEGETNIVDQGKKIQKLEMNPPNCRATPEAIEAIQNAELIVLGPGSLFTSVLPNLLIPEIAEAIESSDALKIHIGNVMTQPGETDNMSVFDHLNVLLEHTKRKICNSIIANIGEIPEDIKEKYAEEDQFPTELDRERIEQAGIEIHLEDIVSIQNNIRHSPQKLAKAIMGVYTKYVKEITENEGQLN